MASEVSEIGDAGLASCEVDSEQIIDGDSVKRDAIVESSGNLDKHEDANENAKSEEKREQGDDVEYESNCSMDPWMSQEIFDLISNKKAKWSLYLKTNKQEDFDAFVKLRNMVTSMVKRAKASHKTAKKENAGDDSSTQVSTDKITALDLENILNLVAPDEAQATTRKKRGVRAGASKQQKKAQKALMDQNMKDGYALPKYNEIRAKITISRIRLLQPSRYRRPRAEGEEVEGDPTYDSEKAGGKEVIDMCRIIQMEEGAKQVLVEQVTLLDILPGYLLNLMYQATSFEWIWNKSVSPDSGSLVYYCASMPDARKFEQMLNNRKLERTGNVIKTGDAYSFENDCIGLSSTDIGFNVFDEHPYLKSVLYVSNLPAEAETADIFRAFPEYVSMVRPCDAQLNQLGYCFLTFRSHVDTVEHSNLTDVYVSGQKLSLFLIQFPQNESLQDRPAGLDVILTERQMNQPFRFRENSASTADEGGDLQTLRGKLKAYGMDMNALLKCRSEYELKQLVVKEIGRSLAGNIVNTGDCGVMGAMAKLAGAAGGGPAPYPGGVPMVGQLIQMISSILPGLGGQMGPGFFGPRGFPGRRPFGRPPFGRPPFGRPPFGRPPFGGPRFGGPPGPRFGGPPGPRFGSPRFGGPRGRGEARPPSLMDLSIGEEDDSSMGPGQFGDPGPFEGPQQHWHGKGERGRHGGSDQREPSRPKKSRFDSGPSDKSTHNDKSKSVLDSYSLGFGASRGGSVKRSSQSAVPMTRDKVVTKAANQGNESKKEPPGGQQSMGKQNAGYGDIFCTDDQRRNRNKHTQGYGSGDKQDSGNSHQQQNIARRFGGPQKNVGFNRSHNTGQHNMGQQKSYARQQNTGQKSYAQQQNTGQQSYARQQNTGQQSYNQQTHAYTQQHNTGQQAYTQPPNTGQQAYTQPPNTGQHAYTQPPNTGQQTYTQPPSTGQQAYTQPPNTGQQTYTQPPSTGQQAYTQPPSTGQQAYTQPPNTGQQAYTQPPNTGQQAYTQPPNTGQQAYTQPPNTGQQAYTQPPSTGQQAYTQPPNTGQQAYTQPPNTGQQAYTQPPNTGQQAYTQPPNTGQQAYTQPPNTGQQAYTQPPNTGQQAYFQQAHTGQQAYTQQPQVTQQSYASMQHGNIGQNLAQNYGVYTPPQSYDNIATNVQNSGDSNSAYISSYGQQTGQTSDLYATGQTSDLYATGQTSSLYATGQTSDLYVTGQTSDLYATGQTSDLYATGQTSNLYATGQTSNLYAPNYSSSSQSYGASQPYSSGPNNSGPNNSDLTQYSANTGQQYSGQSGGSKYGAVGQQYNSQQYGTSDQQYDKTYYSSAAGGDNQNW